MKKSDLYMDYLREEGYLPKLDGDGDVQFKYEGMTCCVFSDELDREYFRVVLPNFWPIESEDERARATAAAVAVTAGIKVGKVILVGDNTWASVEMLVDPIERFRDIFPRAMRILTMCVQRYRDEMQKTTQ